MSFSSLIRIACAATAVVALSARADVRLPAIISDHMVLQADQPIKIWGWSDAGEKVTVKFDGQEASADAGGKWLVTLKPHNPGGPFEMTVASAKNSITVTDILVGECWLGSGQSNMQWPVKLTNNADAEMAGANFPNIRLFSVPLVSNPQPQDDVKGAWVACSPQTIPDFSAVLFYFGRELLKELNTPMGLIQTAWGGTPAEAWTSRPALEADPDLKHMVEAWDKKLADYPAAKAEYDKQKAEYDAAAEKAKAAGQPEPGNKPKAPDGPESSWLAAGLYNAMINPLVPFSVKGAVWYQGESNAGRAYQYRKLFSTMIQDWRKAWGQDHFSFYFVQLANFTDTKPEPGDSEWAELREAQNMALSLPDTGTAVIIDIGDAKDIHPRNKQDVGKRLALNALVKNYGHKVEYSGPAYKGMKVKKNEVVLKFDHAKGLMAKGDKVQGFSIAGEDKKFVWADARIEGNKVIVSAAGVDAPVAVRYAWANNPVCNLYNGDGLPASPFRTDEWPGVTVNNK